MNLSMPPAATTSALSDLTGPISQAKAPEKPNEARETFDKFVGEVFYGQLLKAMRSTQSKPAYFHGGRAEEVFQQQFDQVLTEELTESGAAQFTGPMFELFNMSRR